MATTEVSDSSAPTAPVKLRTLELSFGYEPADPADFSRNRHAPDDELRGLFEKLLNLRHFSEPGALAGMNNGLANEAIQMANQLLSGLIGWALNHRAGKVAKQLEAENENPIHFEEIGRSLSAQELTRELHRNVIADLLASMHTILPPGSALDLAEAIEALNTGEIVPLLEKSSIDKRGFPHRLGIMKLRAIGWVHFISARDDITIEEAKAKVAEAYKVPPDQVKSWLYSDSSAMYSLNPVRVKVERRGWEAAAQIATKLRTSIPVRMTSFEQRWYSRYADSSLESDGDRYHQLWMSKPKKRAP